MEKVVNSQSVYTDIDLFFPYFTDAQKSAALVVPAKPQNLSLCEEVNKLCDVLCPVDPVTGNPDNMIDKLLSPSVNPMEKERILSYMQKIPASHRHNLSDKELISMLPSRYNTTFTDIDKVRDYYEKEIYTDPSLLSDDDVTSAPAPASAPAPSSAPAPASAPAPSV